MRDSDKLFLKSNFETMFYNTSDSDLKFLQRVLFWNKFSWNLSDFLLKFLALKEKSSLNPP